MPTQVKRKQDILKCSGHQSEILKCRGEHFSEKFYNSWNKFGNGKVHFCKDCCQKIFEYYINQPDGNMQKALYYTCQKIDCPFILEIYQKIDERNREAIANKKPFNYLSSYLNELGKYKTKKDLWNDFSCSNVSLEDVDTRIRRQEIKEKEIEKWELDWGYQDEAEDYTRLQNMFLEYTEDLEYELPAYQEDLYRDLCKDRVWLSKLEKKRLNDKISKENEELIEKFNKRIKDNMRTLNLDNFENNKVKTLSQKLFFDKIRMCDEKNVAEVYTEPTKYFDLNKLHKYNKDMVLRPALNSLLNHRDFNINLDDVESYNMDEE